MNRVIIGTGQRGVEIDILRGQLFPYKAFSRGLQAILGDGPWLNELGCVPTTPASLDVVIRPGQLYRIESVDTTNYSVIPIDDLNKILKQATLEEPGVTLAITPPGTAGNSQDYLIQFGFQESDTNIEDRDFFGTPPVVQSVATVRSDLLIVQAKPGVAAPTGSQVTPTPDAGYVGGWVVTVANGQTQITSSNIKVYPGAPFITEKLNDKVSLEKVEELLATTVQPSQIQFSNFIYAQTSGTGTAYSANLTPAIGDYQNGLICKLLIHTVNTGAATLSLNGLPQIPIYLPNGDPLIAGNMPTDHLAEFIYINSSFKLLNPVYPSLIAANGYQYLPNGLIEQWGRAVVPTSPNGGSKAVVEFPIPYQNLLMSIAYSVLGTIYPDPPLPSDQDNRVTTNIGSDQLPFTYPLSSIEVGVYPVNLSLPSSNPNLLLNWRTIGY